MPSPFCEVQDGSNPFQGTTNGVDVTPGNTVTIRLVDSSADAWAISCIYTDDESDAAAVSASLDVDPLAKTASFTAPASGRAYIFQSVVNGGVGPDGRVKPSYTATFGVYTRTVGGRRVMAANEMNEGDASFGWVKPFNELVRNAGSPNELPARVERKTANGVEVSIVGEVLAGEAGVDILVCTFEPGAAAAHVRGSAMLIVDTPEDEYSQAWDLRALFTKPATPEVWAEKETIETYTDSGHPTKPEFRMDGVSVWLRLHRYGGQKTTYRYSLRVQIQRPIP